MRKTRRIEITAFRRTVTMHGGPGMEPPQSPGSGLISADSPATQLNQADLVEAVLSTVEDAGSPRLEHLIEALIVSNGEDASADEQDGLKPGKIHSVLHSFGVPVTRLRELLDELCDRRSLKSAKKYRRD